ncbi:MAG: TonB-dependent receptor plug domain-containing protein [Rhodoferax sp.]|nr:TonB-dependent receptor plug domain-containing protein [Rhodoferax sp.]
MKLLPTRLTAIALAAAGIPIEFALAQDAEKPLEKVVITARKRSEPLQEVPVAAKTFSAQTLADENIVDQKSLVARTASASTVEQGASFASEVVLRGAGVGRAVNAETSTGLYRNGAYAAGGNIGGRAFNKMDFFDVQRVEVMRGPQAALYGRGAVGGAMNIINNRPSAVASRALTLTGGPYDSFGMEAIINQPISDAVNIRAGLKTSSSKGGAVRDVTTSEALDSDRFDGARVSMEINPGGSFNYNLMVDGFSESGPSFGVFQYELAKPETRFTRNYNSPARFGRNEWTAIGEGVWDLGGPTVVALTQLKRRKASTSDDFDRFNVVSNANLQRWQRLSDDDMERFGQELRIQGKDGQRLQWLAGAEYLRLKDRFTVDLNGAIARARQQLNKYYGVRRYIYRHVWPVGL